MRRPQPRAQPHGHTRAESVVGKAAEKQRGLAQRSGSLTSRLPKVARKSSGRQLGQPGQPGQPRRSRKAASCNRALRAFAAEKEHTDIHQLNVEDLFMLDTDLMQHIADMFAEGDD